MTTSLLQGKVFYCREWVFSKIAKCLEPLSIDWRGSDPPTDITASTELKSGTTSAEIRSPGGSSPRPSGTIIMGGPGCGKTALCCEIIWPTRSQPAGKTTVTPLGQRVLAYYFCQAHDVETLSVANFISCITEQIHRCTAINLTAKSDTDSPVVDAVLCETDPDQAFKMSVITPLLSVSTPPQESMFILVDSLDESYLQSFSERAVGSRTIAELLAAHHHLLPSWLYLVCTSRRQTKSITKLFAGFRKISLDDQRKSHVVRDVQQYILCRLDRDERLRQYLSRETAEMLNQLHIKSNGCMLYIEKVLDGVVDGFIRLEEIREMPGTLNGLYLWLCQRLFTAKSFDSIRPILNVIFAARRPLTDLELYSCIVTRDTSLRFSEFRKKIGILERVLTIGRDGTRILFHYSFAEWLLDVKYCTRRYLCTPAEGHTLLALSFTLHAPTLSGIEIHHFAFHVAKSDLTPPLEPWHYPLWLVASGAEVGDALTGLVPREQAAVELLLRAGARLPMDEALASSITGMSSSAGEELDAALNPDARGDDSEHSGQPALCTAAFQGNIMRVKELLSRSSSLCDGEGSICEKELVKDEDCGHIGLDDKKFDRNLAEDRSKSVGLNMIIPPLGCDLLTSPILDIEAEDPNGQTALCLAARYGHADIVAELLAAGAKVDHADQEGWTALRSAAWGGHLDVITLLLAAGAAVDQSDRDGRTAIRASAWGGHMDIVTELLDHGANVNCADNEGRTPLIAAAYMGHNDIVRLLLSRGAAVNQEDIDGRTALSVAALRLPASHSHVDVVTTLIEHGAEVDHNDRDGMTPFCVAAFEGHADICELLLENDADIDHTDTAGRSALEGAVCMGHVEVVRLLLFWGAYVDMIDGDGRTVLCSAAQQGNVEIVQLLLDRGLDETHRDNFGWSPLHIAAFEGNSEVVQALLDAGAQVLECDNDGRIPLLLAAQEGHVTCVAILLDAGSPIEAHGHDGKNAIRLAAIEGHSEVVHCLLSYGADINRLDPDHRSTVYALAAANIPDMLAVLLEARADPSLADLERRTPLHVAAWAGNIRVVELLLNHGADADARDRDLRTPLQSAAWSGHADVVSLLLSRGVEVDHASAEGATALAISVQQGHEEVVRVLLQHSADVGHVDSRGRTPVDIALAGKKSRIIDLLRSSPHPSKTRRGGDGVGRGKAKEGLRGNEVSRAAEKRYSGEVGYRMAKTPVSVANRLSDGSRPELSQAELGYKLATQSERLANYLRGGCEDERRSVTTSPVVTSGVSSIDAKISCSSASIHGATGLVTTSALPSCHSNQSSSKSSGVHVGGGSNSTNLSSSSGEGAYKGMEVKPGALPPSAGDFTELSFVQELQRCSSGSRPHKHRSLSKILGVKPESTTGSDTTKVGDETGSKSRCSSAKGSRKGEKGEGKPHGIERTKSERSENREAIWMRRSAERSLEDRPVRRESKSERSGAGGAGAKGNQGSRRGNSGAKETPNVRDNVENYVPTVEALSTSNGKRLSELKKETPL